MGQGGERAQGAAEVDVNPRAPMGEKAALAALKAAMKELDADIVRRQRAARVPAFRSYRNGVEITPSWVRGSGNAVPGQTLVGPDAEAEIARARKGMWP